MNNSDNNNVILLLLPQTASLVPTGLMLYDFFLYVFMYVGMWVNVFHLREFDVPALQSLALPLNKVKPLSRGSGHSYGFISVKYYGSYQYFHAGGNISFLLVITRLLN